MQATMAAQLRHYQHQPSDATGEPGYLVMGVECNFRLSNADPRGSAALLVPLADTFKQPELPNLTPCTTSHGAHSCQTPTSRPLVSRCECTVCLRICACATSQASVKHIPATDCKKQQHHQRQHLRYSMHQSNTCAAQQLSFYHLARPILVDVRCGSAVAALLHGSTRPACSVSLLSL